MGVVNERKIAVYLINGKILIETLSQKNIGIWNSTKFLTLLPSDVSSRDLGESILHHLHLSKMADIPMEEVRANWKNLINKSGSKTVKAFYEAGRRVTILASNDKLIFEPFSADVSQRIFYRIPEYVEEILKAAADAVLLGDKVRDKWLRCTVAPL